MAKTSDLNNNHALILTCNVSHFIMLIIYLFVCFVSLFHDTVSAGWEVTIPAKLP